MAGKQIERGAVHLWRSSLSVSGNVPSTPADRERASRLRSSADRDRFLARRSILRLLLGRYLDMDPATLPIAVSPSGKPYVARASSKVHFSVSCVGGTVLVAIAGAETGVDVELIAPARIDDAVAERFFSAVERRYLRRLRADEQAAAYFGCWTLKEALAKATGQGLSLPLRSFDLAPRGPAAAVVTALAYGAEEMSSWSVRPVQLERGLAAAVAVEGALIDVEHFSL